MCEEKCLTGERIVIGYWLSEKKRSKLKWNESQNVCAKQGFVLKLVNLNFSLDSQGPFDVFLHKLTDTLAHAEAGDSQARAVVNRVESYIRRNPKMIVVDPLESVKKVRDRQNSYEILREMQCNDVFVPNSIELKSRNVSDNLTELHRHNIKFPFMCKPLLAQGSSNAHQMMVIFNEEGVKDCQPPCIVQNFVNHNAILYKVYIVGNHFHVVERPSLKNFYPKDCETLGTLFFSSHDVSKSGSTSEWSVISKQDEALTVKPNYGIFKKIVSKATKLFGLVLVGVDVVIENHTGRYAIIDVNAFPGYDGYPHFFMDLVETIKLRLSDQKARLNYHRTSILTKCMSTDLESGVESDEKKKQSMK
ncbi:inositol-tetrakisphosphate 1-kinase [Fopius arisanus]|uniref:Inositol-tetrakisphosphate 1-kinase n=1 Tax=Fopius arisanus TaxID=64838 RepID=A0A9R1U6T5_9HYME|nr:PREDICTED: inositol-tetrakisphosphate 1-kinase-like [Fopius arisanus]